LQYWGLSSGPTSWATPPPFFVKDFFNMGSHELFAWVGFELRAILLISTSWLSRITAVTHPGQAKC
jgi:hypothetical protein